jgi:hypothetical protein
MTFEKFWEDNCLDSPLFEDAAQAVWDNATAAANERIERLNRENEVLYAEREHARHSLDNAVQLLSGIHALLYPPRMTDSKGVTFVFHSPHVHEQMQELSDRIRALPDEVTAILKKNDNQT